MADPKFADVIPVGVVMSGDVTYAIMQASTGRFFDGTAFVDTTGEMPPTFAVPEVPGLVGFRRIDIPIPPTVFTPDVYFVIYLSSSNNVNVPVTTDVWDLRDPAWNPTPARFAGWVNTYDPTARSWSSKYVDGPK
jgi:hypothetical protein